MGENIVDTAVFLDQIAGSLGADSLHPGDIVRGIPLQGLDVNQLMRGHAVLIQNGGLVIQRYLRLAKFGHRQAHRHAIPHQLQAVAVPGGDHAFRSLFPAGLGKGSQNIVGLPSGALDHGVSQISQQLFEHRHLLGQLVGHAVAPGLVPGIGDMTEGGLFPVERDGHRIGPALLPDMLQHGQKAIDRISKLSVFCREQLDAVKSAVDNAVPIQYKQFHVRTIPSRADLCPVIFRPAGVCAGIRTIIALFACKNKWYNR